MTDLVELKSLVDTHERPFVVIGGDFEVLAVNKAGDAVVGRKCHQVLHHREHPCSEVGEECPYVHERGAFTGSIRSRPGISRACCGSTGQPASGREGDGDQRAHPLSKTRKVRAEDALTGR